MTLAGGSHSKDHRVIHENREADGPSAANGPEKVFGGPEARPQAPPRPAEPTLLNQASGDRKILAERLNLSPDHQKYIDNSEPGAGLLIFENVILPFTNPIPSNTELYKIMTTRLSEVVAE